MSRSLKLATQLVAQMTLAEKMSQLKFDAPAIPRLGIPAYNWWNECLHGVGRSGTATVFPQAIAMAASFNAKLVERAASAISDEVRAKYNQYKKFGDTLIYQGLTCWSPNINIFRDPRWGRGHETYGEDPYLTAQMGIAFVRGLQGEDYTRRKADATLKHYAVHSGPEQGRHSFDAVVGKKDLYETYLYAFGEIIKQARPAAVMGAYNRVNSQPCCASEYLLNDVLRGELGFEGYVVSDCGAISDIYNHHKLAHTMAHAAAMAVSAGCDLNCGGAYASLQVAYDQGLITEDDITRSAIRLFAARHELGMFEPTQYDDIPYDIICCDYHEELNEELARQSLVLCKNDGILPLDKNINVAVIGPNADSVDVLLGNYNGTPATYTTILRGIQQTCGGRVIYARGSSLADDKPQGWAEQPLREAIIAARHSDVVILVLGLSSRLEGEEGDAYNGDLSGDKPDIELPLVQKELFDSIVAAGKPVICVNVSGSAIALGEQDKKCSAVVQCFYPGTRGGSALAAMLFGEFSPSGRLPVTFYEKTSDLPPFDDYSMANRTYRYFTGKPLYEFGHGLSYVDMKYSDIKARVDGDSVHIGFDVQNTGDMAAAETALIYLSDEQSGITTPIKRLVRIHNMRLEPGGIEHVELTLIKDDMAVYGGDGVARFAPGEYTITVGGLKTSFYMK